MPYRGGALPILRLSSVLGIAGRDRPRACTPSSSAPGAAAVGLLVDRILGQREIVVRAIADPLIRVRRACRAPPTWATAARC